MTEKNLQERFVSNFKRLRAKKDLTQEKLAELADISPQMINGIEGYRRFPSKPTLVKLANALDCDVHEFFIPTPKESAEMSDLYKTVGTQIASEIQAGVNKILGEWL